MTIPYYAYLQRLSGILPRIPLLILFFSSPFLRLSFSPSLSFTPSLPPASLLSSLPSSPYLHLPPVHPHPASWSLQSQWPLLPSSPGNLPPSSQSNRPRICERLGAFTPFLQIIPLYLATYLTTSLLVRLVDLTRLRQPSGLGASISGGLVATVCHSPLKACLAIMV